MGAELFDLQLIYVLAPACFSAAWEETQSKRKVW
jgi:hypothetical protein